jgi:hypothetical protein
MFFHSTANNFPVTSANMHFSNLLVVFGLEASFVLVSARPEPVSSSSRYTTRALAPARAAYLITNDDENAVAALHIESDGTLTKGAVTLTGGRGSNVRVPGGTAPQAPDALVAQSSLTIAENVRSTVAALCSKQNE